MLEIASPFGEIYTYCKMCSREVYSGGWALSRSPVGYEDSAEACSYIELHVGTILNGLLASQSILELIKIYTSADSQPSTVSRIVRHSLQFFIKVLHLARDFRAIIEELTKADSIWQLCYPIVLERWFIVKNTWDTSESHKMTGASQNMWCPSMGQVLKHDRSMSFRVARKTIQRASHTQY